MDGMIVFLHKTPAEQLSNLDTVRGSETPTDFRYHTYDASTLPNIVIVQPMVVGAFKLNCSYCAVLMAYRNATDGYDMLYASSKPSTAFKIGEWCTPVHLLSSLILLIVYDSAVSGFSFRSRYAHNVAGIVLGGVVPVLLCLAAIVVLMVWCKFRKKKNARNSKYHRSKEFK